MTSQSNWHEIAAEAVDEAYPDSDLLPIEPPRSGETISEFSVRAEPAGDTLFLFLCREADEEIDTPEYLARLSRAIGDDPFEVARPRERRPVQRGRGCGRIHRPRSRLRRDRRG